MVRTLWFSGVAPREVRRHLGLLPDPGPQAWVDRLAEELSKRGDMELSIASPSAAPYGPFVSDGVWYYGVPTRSAGTRVRRIADDWRHRLEAPATLVAAGSLIRAVRPDIVHIHGTENAFGTAATSGPAPCVVSLQGLLQQSERVYFAGRTTREVTRLLASAEFLKGRGAVHGYLWMRAMARREAETMRRGRWFIGRTDWDRATLAAVNPEATYYHGDEIMRREFYAADWAATDHHSARLYSTSSAMLFKGTEMLLEAAAILRRAGVQDLHVRIAGVPPGSEVDGLYRRAARRWGVDDIVDWLGRLDAAAIAAELEAADVFVYPTHSDNSPNALVEAMLAGAPIAATRAGGIPSLVRDGEEGLLVPRGDSAALAAAVRRLLNDRDAAARLGGAARRRALVRNDPQRVAAQTVAIYGEIIAAAAASGVRPA